MISMPCTGSGYQYGYDYFFKRHSHFLGIYGSGICLHIDERGFLSCQISGCTGYFRYNELYIRSCIHDIHKITDTHIGNCGGSIKALSTPIPMTRIFTGLNWAVLWSFVFKKTIPLFWYPAHTITFLLPPDMRVLFAAILGVVLGVLLAIAAKKK